MFRRRKPEKRDTGKIYSSFLNPCRMCGKKAYYKWLGMTYMATCTSEKCLNHAHGRTPEEIVRRWNAKNPVQEESNG